MQDVFEALDEVESTDFVQDLKRCAEEGIFIHNADVPRKVRAAFERYLASTLPAQWRSEVVIATETLSYGVNLQISDVALLNVLFPENERVPTSKPESVLLSRCDFVNMSGRAGRLGQGDSEASANVFWFLDPEEESSFESVLRTFYSPQPGVRSSLLYRSDSRSLANLRKLREQAALLDEEVSEQPPREPAAVVAVHDPAGGLDSAGLRTRYSAVEQLSYPFTRSVLDSVRFLGGTAGSVGFLGKAGCTIEELITGFFFETLFHKQMAEASTSPRGGISRCEGQEGGVSTGGDRAQASDRLNRKQRELIQAVKQVVESASLPEYQLVRQLSSGSYQITALGSASIDTGTEIKTVVNLRHAILAVNLAWKKYFDRGLPFELAVLPAFFQPEVNRQYVARLPEFRLAMEWSAPENREDLISRCAESLVEVGALRASELYQFRAAVAEFVHWIISNQPIVSEPGRYEEAAYDSCLRLFVGFLAWIQGRSLRAVIGEIQSIYPSSGQKTEASVFNFEAFSDNLTWKIMFLVSLVRASGERILPAASTFNAVRFVHRSRFGCVEQAIPLLFRNKTTIPPINRVEAHSMLSDGHTSASIALGRLDGTSQIGANKERALRRHVRRYIFESFQEVSRQFSYLASGSGLGKLNEDLSKEYWSFALGQIRALLDSAGPINLGWGAGHVTDSVWKTALLDKNVDSPQLVLKCLEDGMLIETYVPGFESDSDAIKLDLKSSFRAIFSFGLHDSSIFDIDADSERTVIVDFPWTMGVQEDGQGFLRVSPAAFGILLSLCSRDFVSDVDRYLSAVLGHRSDLRIGSRELYSLTEPHLKKGGFPEGLFDAWAKYIEVGEF